MGAGNNRLLSEMKQVVKKYTRIYMLDNNWRELCSQNRRAASEARRVATLNERGP